jgi:hypothetical protein
MFGKIEYKLLIENYMTKDEYKKLIEQSRCRPGSGFT